MKVELMSAGWISLDVDANLSNLTEREFRFVVGLIDRFREYEGRRRLLAQEQESEATSTSEPPFPLDSVAQIKGVAT